MHVQECGEQCGEHHSETQNWWAAGARRATAAGGGGGCGPRGAGRPGAQLLRQGTGLALAIDMQ